MCTDCETTQASPVFGRRHFFGLAAAALSTGIARAGECVFFDSEALTATSPDQAIQMFMGGNARFVAGGSLN